MELQAYHDSHKKFFREPFGAVSCGQGIILRLVLNTVVPGIECKVRLWESEQEKIIPMRVLEKFKIQDEAEDAKIVFEVGDADNFLRENHLANGDVAGQTVFEAEYAVPAEPGLVWYYFIITGASGSIYYGNNEQRLGGVGRSWNYKPPAYQITVCRPQQIPDWYQKGIMYQIFVDRFFKGQEEGLKPYPRKNALIHANWEDDPIYIRDKEDRVIYWDFFGGNLRGVIEKLPYLKELGISTIYLNPIFDSPSNHKYDTGDYFKIDPMYGDEETFKQLVTGAERCGIGVILDGVFSHTGNDSLYFNEYGTYPALGAYQSPDSPYYEWYKKSGPAEWKYWWNITSLPEVDEMNPSYREFIFNTENGVISKWMGLGIAGWRLDVADELPDQFIRELRQVVKELNPAAVLIGEVWEDASNKVSYGKLREYFWGSELDAVMNYPFRNFFLDFLLGREDAGLLCRRVMSLRENYPRENFYAAMNLIGSHDRARILTLLGEAPEEENLTESERRAFRLSPATRQRAVQRLKLLSLVQMTFPGVPCIYYGDEAGIEGYSDPLNRRTYPWGKEDPEILDWYKRMIFLRQEYEALQTGDFRQFSDGPDVYGLQRSGKGEIITVLLNRHSELGRAVNLALPPGSGTIDLLSGEWVVPEQTGEVSLHIPPLSARAVITKTGIPYKEMPYNAALAELPLSRACGLLMHVSSLPSAWGSGDMGEEAYRFVDFLAECGHSVWQVLPLNPSGAGNSPYQSDSAFAGNPLLISLERLQQEGLIDSNDLEEKMNQVKKPNQVPVSPEDVKKIKGALLRSAFEAFQEIGVPESGQDPSEYLSLENYRLFLRENAFWLEDYALYKALKEHFGDMAWFDWEPEIAARRQEAVKRYQRLLAAEIEFNRFVQYTFYVQWMAVRHYAGEKGVKITGDMPLYVAADSCDTWVNRSFFDLDERGKPAKLAGVPPDYFSRTGQLWGNPVYDWETLAADGYSWWKLRIRQALRLFDYVRIDHFRGLARYWEVKAGEKTAINGRWLKGPGKRFLESLEAELGALPLLAEDLGLITPEVNVLKCLFGLPGMKVLQFTPLEEGLANHDTNLIYYTGTHDNDTLLGWYRKSTSAQRERIEMAGLPDNEKELRSNGERSSDGKQSPEIMKDAGDLRYCRKMIEDLYHSEAAWVILPVQDILGLDSEARMNVPGTAEGNWCWQMAWSQMNPEVKSWLRTLAEKSERTSPCERH